MMPIEKLEIKTEYDYDRDKHVVDFEYVSVLNKINELIETVNKLTKTPTVFPMPQTKPEDL